MEHNETIENLEGSDAISKIQDLVEAEPICMFTTNLSSHPLATRPMASLNVDDMGNIWFFSSKSSEKNRNIQANSAVQLFYCNHGSSEYLSVYGHADISTDIALIKELWSPMAKAWFTEGVEDPEITVIRLVPEQAYYWDTKSNKLISMIKIFASVVTGTTSDDGVQGTLHV